MSRRSKPVYCDHDCNLFMFTRVTRRANRRNKRLAHRRVRRLFKQYGEEATTKIIHTEDGW